MVQSAWLILVSLAWSIRVQAYEGYDFEQCGQNIVLQNLTKIQHIAVANNASQSAHGTWPWLVSAGFQERSRWVHSCGGSIISNRHVLTAAHCTGIKGMRLRFGDQNHYSSADDDHVVLRDMVTYVHPKFAESGIETVYYDVAIWELESPIEFNDFIQPICLPRLSNDDANAHKDEQVDIIGWGQRFRGAALDGVLRHAPLKIFDQEWCNLTHAKSFDSVNVISERWPQLFPSCVMCAGHSNGGYGSCKGDSGSPLVKFESSGVQPRFYQLGVIVGGVGACGNREYPSTYTRIEDFEIMNFINSVLKRSTLELRSANLPSSSLPIFAQAESAQDVKDILESRFSQSINEVFAAVLIQQATERLVELDEDLDFSFDVQGTTLLHASVRYNMLKTFKDLIWNGADLDIQNKIDQTPLHLAAQFGRQDMLELALQYYADTDIIDGLGRNALHVAAKHGRLSIVKTLLAHGVDIDSLDEQQRTPLHLTLANKKNRNANNATALFLIKSNANVTLTDLDGNQAIHVAARTAEPVVIQQLLYAGASPSARRDDGRTPLLIACSEPNVEVIQFLIQSAGVDVTERDYNKFTGLHYAARAGHFFPSKILIKEGLDIDSQDVRLSTPLHLAARNGHHRLVKLLIKEKANVNMQSLNGKSALMATLKYTLNEEDHTQTASALIYGKTDLHLMDKVNQTAKDYAVLAENDVIIKLIDDVLEERVVLEDVEEIVFQTSKRNFQHKVEDKILDPVEDWLKGDGPRDVADSFSEHVVDPLNKVLDGASGAGDKLRKEVDRPLDQLHEVIEEKKIERELSRVRDQIADNDKVDKVQKKVEKQVQRIFKLFG